MREVIAPGAPSYGAALRLYWRDFFDLELSLSVWPEKATQSCLSAYDFLFMQNMHCM